MSDHTYEIIGHRLCPYVQRVVITLIENQLDYLKLDIDLDHKPDWLRAISPNSKVPVLKTGTNNWLFESTSISKYLIHIHRSKMLPDTPLERAQQNSWIIYSDDILGQIAKTIYLDKTETEFIETLRNLNKNFQTISSQFQPRPYFNGDKFGLLDAIWISIFRYLPVFDFALGTYNPLQIPPALNKWWKENQRRHSVQASVPVGFADELKQFIAQKNSFLANQLKH